MNALRDIARFKSARFSPVLPEDCQLNPQVYGAELAYWLCTELARRGVATSYPNSEDWGWFIEYLPQSGSEFAVHCGNVDGAQDQWLLSLRRHARKVFGRDKPPYEGCMTSTMRHKRSSDVDTQRHCAVRRIGKHGPCGAMPLRAGQLQRYRSDAT
jgi:hypothetical protein